MFSPLFINAITNKITRFYDKSLTNKDLVAHLDEFFKHKEFLPVGRLSANDLRWWSDITRHKLTRDRKRPIQNHANVNFVNFMNVRVRYIQNNWLGEYMNVDVELYEPNKF